MSGLITELGNLRRQITRTDKRLEEMSDEFWRSGGVCCPTCGMPGYSELQWKQERRAIRVKQIEEKLNRDSRHIGNMMREGNKEGLIAFINRHNKRRAKQIVKRIVKLFSLGS